MVLEALKDPVVSSVSRATILRGVKQCSVTHTLSQMTLSGLLGQAYCNQVSPAQTIKYLSR